MPVTIDPARNPPRAYLPKNRPTAMGAMRLSTPGRTSSLKAPRVAMSTQRLLSGLALPSSKPGISRN